MSNSQLFAYADGQSLEEYKCDICTRPLIDPVALPDLCDKTFCRKCLEENFKLHTLTCSKCCGKIWTQADIKPEGRKLRLILDRLVVHCRVCGRTNIRRGQFDEHYNRQCPKPPVVCSANDIGCSWKGPFEEAARHLQSCHYVNLRPYLEQMVKENKSLKDLHVTLQNKCQNLQKLNDQNEKSLSKLNDDLMQSEKKCEDRQKLFDNFQKLTNDFERLQKSFADSTNRFDQVNIEKDQIRSEKDQIVAENQRLTSENEKLNEENSRQHAEIDVLTKDHHDLKKLFDEKEIEKKNLEDQYRQIERQVLEQKLLIETLQIDFKHSKSSCSEQQATNNRLTSVSQTLENEIHQKTDLMNEFESRSEDENEEENSTYSNETLEDLLSFCTNRNLVNLTGQKLIDHDLNIVVRFAIKEKHCSILLLSNNQIGPSGVGLLAPILYRSSSLTQLNLSQNRLSDDGTRILAKALTKDNQTLVTLNLGANDIGDDGVSSLADMLKFNQTLRVLGLQENRIKDRGVRNLSNSLRTKNRTLIELSLYSNSSITDRSIDSFIEVLAENQCLETLWLWNCDLSIDGQRHLTENCRKNENFDLRLTISN